MADTSLRKTFTIKKGSTIPGGNTELAEQINLARASIVTALEYIANAQTFGLDTTYGAAFRIKGFEAAQAAALYGQKAMKYCKDKDEYAEVYKELENGYLGSVEASKMISALTASSLTDNWNKTAAMLQGSGEAFTKAETALGNIK